MNHVFKNGYVMTVIEVGDFWNYEVTDGEGDFVDQGCTHKVNLELYDCEEPWEYIVKWCSPTID